MIIVSAGIVINQGKILLAQRKPGVSHGLKWEFPGGKLESGESPQAALERELREELGIQKRNGSIFDARYIHDSDRELLILFFFSKIESGIPETIDCNRFEWVSREALLQYDLADADRAVAAQLQTAERTV